jgi:hydrogenase maturation factor
MTEGRVVFVVESEDRDRVLEALNRINVPVASIMEAEEVKPKMPTTP